MVSVINSWAQGIILAIIIATIIEIILPEGNNKKYVKTIIGIYILFVMISPFISTNKININSIIQETTTQVDEYNTEDLTLETNQYIQETYISKIEQDLKDKVKNMSYNVVSLKLDIETNNEEKYGEIKSINLKISKIENKEQNIENNTVQKIDNVEISISKENVLEEENMLTDNELEELKEYLSNEYGVQRDKIHINE